MYQFFAMDIVEALRYSVITIFVLISTLRKRDLFALSVGFRLGVTCRPLFFREKLKKSIESWKLLPNDTKNAIRMHLPVLVIWIFKDEEFLCDVDDLRWNFRCLFRCVVCYHHVKYIFAQQKCSLGWNDNVRKVCQQPEWNDWSTSNAWSKYNSSKIDRETYSYWLTREDWSTTNFLTESIQSIYENIKTNEFKFPDDALNANPSVFTEDSAVIKEGWLWKQGSSNIESVSNKILNENRFRWPSSKLEAPLVRHHRRLSLLLRVTNRRTDLFVFLTVRFQSVLILLSKGNWNSSWSYSSDWRRCPRSWRRSNEIILLWDFFAHRRSSESQ